MTNDTTILLIGHGSRNPAGNEEIRRFSVTWQARHPDWRIEVCFIELADVLLDEGLDRAAAGSRQVIALPLVLNAAGHVKMEIPTAIDAARLRHPAVTFSCLPHLGMGREVYSVLKHRIDHLMQELAMPDPKTTGVILLGRGSSDAGANGEVARIARWVFEDAHHDLVDIAFTGVAFPRLETVVQRQVKLGMTQIVIQPLYLFTGLLIERIKSQAARLRTSYPQVAFALGGHFGFDEGILALADGRVQGASTGGMLECDGCKYRLAAASAHEHHHDHGHDHPVAIPS
jgi:sirohydrochlorin cobaltochelatase